jgi:DNA-binding transcriptional MerR regulator
MDRHLSPAEAAKRFGTSIKALRLYEQRGLLTPVRTRNGSTGSAWRTYGPDQIARLHSILALKNLGLSLARVAELLNSTDALDPILQLQEHKLIQDRDRLSHALNLVRAARAKLASGKALSIDDLANLTKETVMTPTKEETKALFDQTFAQHFTEEERIRIVQNRTALLAEWTALKPALLAAMAIGDPTTAAARDVAKRCQALSRKMLGPDGELRSRFQAFRDAVTQNPQISGIMQVTPEMSLFLKQSLAAK